MATVESVCGVKISSNNGQPSGLGTLGGGNGSIIAGIIGSLANAVAGNAVENNVATKKRSRDHRVSRQRRPARDYADIERQSVSGGRAGSAAVERRRDALMLRT